MKVIDIARDPGQGSIAVAWSMVVAGFAAAVLAWHGAATTSRLAVQVAYMVSGGMAGLAVTATGLAVLLVQRTRRVAAQENDIVARIAERLIDDARGVR